MSDTTFMLFVEGKNDSKTKLVTQNLEKICKYHDLDYDLIVIDITENPQVTESLKIIATPFLIKTEPKPEKRFIGDLSGTDLDSFMEVKS